MANYPECVCKFLPDLKQNFLDSVYNRLRTEAGSQSVSLRPFHKHYIKGFPNQAYQDPNVFPPEDEKVKNWNMLINHLEFLRCTGYIEIGSAKSFLELAPPVQGKPAYESSDCLIRLTPKSAGQTSAPRLASFTCPACDNS